MNGVIAEAGAPAPPTSRGLPGLRSLDHVACTVPDLEAAIDFFSDHLGARLVYRDGPFQGPGLPGRLNVPPSARCELAMLRLGDTTNLELFRYEAPTQAQVPPRNSDVGGHHLAFYVDDIDAAHSYLAAVPGVTLMAGPNDADPHAPVAGQRWFYFTSPWGLQMEATSDGLGGFYDGLPGAGMVPPSPRPQEDGA